jgi:hypothetical protein
MTSSKHLENLRPEQLLQLDVFFCTSEQRLAVAYFVVYCVLHHLLENSFFVSVFSHEILVAFVGGDDKVDQHTDFVSETLVIFLMSFLDDFVELGL